jgi:hypothetical protein
MAVWPVVTEFFGYVRASVCPYVWHMHSMETDASQAKQCWFSFLESYNCLWIDIAGILPGATER